MKISMIRINFNPEANEIEQNLATTAVYSESKWEFNGPLYPRYVKIISEIMEVIQRNKG